MVSEFEKLLERNRQEAERKLRLVAPRLFTDQPQGQDGRFTGGGLGGREQPGIIEGGIPTPTEAELTAQQIKQQKQNIISQGGRTTTKRSKDVRTSERLDITETRGRGGVLIREVTNLDTGALKVNVFAPGKAGGSVAFQKGVFGVAEKPKKVIKIDIPETTKVIIPKDLKIDFPKGRPDEIFNPKLGAFVKKSDTSGQATGFIRPPTAAEKLAIDEAAVKGSEVTIFPALIGPKFLSSRLAAEQLRGNVEEEERFEIERTKDLIERSGTLDPRKFIDKRKAALELLRLMRNKDRDVQSDQRRAEKLAQVMEQQNKALFIINRDLKNKTITPELAAKRQNQVLQKFKNNGFNIKEENGKVEISHSVFNRLNRFGGSAWRRLLTAAEKGDHSIRDKSLLAGLVGFNLAYQGAKIFLAFQLAGIGAGALGLSAPAITGSAGSLRLLGLSGKVAGATIVPSFALLSGAKVKAETGSTLLAISATLGTLAGIAGTGRVVGNIKIRNKLKAELERELAKLSPERRIAFKEYMKQTQVLQRFEPKANNIKLNNIESIKDVNAQKAIRQFLKTNKGKVIVGGSVAQTGQVKVLRKLGDMDLYVEGGLTPNQAARLLGKQLKASGVQRVSVIRGQVTIAGKKAIEFHDIERLLTNIRQVTPNFSDPRSYIIKTPEGIRIQRIALQAQRKLVAAFADPQRFATGKYVKDLKDFKAISEKLIRNAEKTIKGSGIIRPRGTKAFEQRFGKVIKRPTLDDILNLKINGKFRTPPILRNIPKKSFGGIGSLLKLKIVKKVPLVRTPKVKGVTRRGFPSQSQVRVNGGFRTAPILLPSQTRIKSSFGTPKLTPSQKFLKKSQKFIKGVPSQVAVTRKKLLKPFAGFKTQPSQKPTKKPSTTSRFIPSQAPVKKPFAFPPGVGAKPPKKRKKPPLTPEFFGIKPPEIIKLLAKKSKPGYNAFAKAKKSKKFIKLNKVPITKKQALSLSAYGVDRSITGTGKIKAVNKPAQRPRVIFPTNYFRQTSRKWRGKIIKKKQTPIKDLFIERRRFRLDILNEKQTIQAFKKKLKVRKIKK